MAGQNDVVIEGLETAFLSTSSAVSSIWWSTVCAAHHEALGRCNYVDGSRVLDIGCGFGDSTRLIAERVRPTGRAIGVDCAASSSEAAAEETSEAGGRQRFLLRRRRAGRATFADPTISCSRASGRCSSPRPARRCATSARRCGLGGQLMMIVWRRREENSVDPRCGALRQGNPAGHFARGNGSGALRPRTLFRWRGADMVSAMLRAAGYDRIAFERFDADICIGRNPRRRSNSAMALGPAGEIIRLAGDVGQQRKPGVVAWRSARLLPRYERGEGVWGPSEYVVRDCAQSGEETTDAGMGVAPIAAKMRLVDDRKRRTHHLMSVPMQTAQADCEATQLLGEGSETTRTDSSPVWCERHSGRPRAAASFAGPHAGESYPTRGAGPTIRNDQHPEAITLHVCFGWGLPAALYCALGTRSRAPTSTRDRRGRASQHQQSDSARRRAGD